MSRLVPTELGLRIEPGTASTSRPRSAAQRAVLSAPLLAVASTTTTASASAAMMRLRRGKRQPTGGSEPPSSESDAPALGDLVAELAMLARVAEVDAAAEHRDGVALAVESAAVGGARRCRGPCR